MARPRRDPIESARRAAAALAAVDAGDEVDAYDRYVVWARWIGRRCLVCGRPVILSRQVRDPLREPKWERLTARQKQDEMRADHVARIGVGRGPTEVMRALWCRQHDEERPAGWKQKAYAVKKELRASGVDARNVLTEHGWKMELTAPDE